MRIIFTICALFCCVGLVSAQTEKGNFFLGGKSSMNISSTENEYKSDYGTTSEKLKKLEFSPQIGYFLAEGFVIGSELLISTSKSETDDDVYKHSGVAIVPFARYYFGKTNLKPYLQAGLGFGSYKSKYDYDHFSEDYNGEYKSTQSLYKLEGGLGIFLNKSVALDLGLGYSSVTMKQKDRDDNNKTTVKGFALNVGFVICL
jgi:opacity protein-like surface antigen